MVSPAARPMLMPLAVQYYYLSLAGLAEQCASGSDSGSPSPSPSRSQPGRARRFPDPESLRLPLLLCVCVCVCVCASLSARLSARVVRTTPPTGIRAAANLKLLVQVLSATVTGDLRSLPLAVSLSLSVCQPECASVPVCYVPVCPPLRVALALAVCQAAVCQSHSCASRRCQTSA